MIKGRGLWWLQKKHDGVCKERERDRKRVTERERERERERHPQPMSLRRLIYPSQSSLVV